MSGYIYLGVFFLLSAYYFVISNLMAGSNSVAEYFQNMITTLMFLIPILTMRSFAEEKKQKTDQLLFTLPMKTSSVIIAKLFASYVVFAAGILSTLVFVVIISFLGNVDIYTTIGCYVGIFAAGTTFIALGVFISSLTENQTTAAIITYAVLFGLYLITYVADYINNNFLISIIDGIAVFSRYTNFTRAVFDPSAIVYYVTLTFAFYEFTLLSLTKDKAD
ncbi:MAG: ABC transporter permease [Lachnospiraceae bacterium]|nr:ABC transporter permease [Lachnospiraceae bacterium]